MPGEIWTEINPVEATKATSAAASSQRPVQLSVVSTMFRSSAFIEEFYKRITAEARKIASDYEIIFVDDGSPDDSLDRALSLLKHDQRVRVIELSRNFGHHKAMMTGIEQARGEKVFLIDVDLEEAPELLGQFHEEMIKGNWDVVYGCQESRKGGLFERSTGAVAWWLVDVLLPVKVPQNHSTVRLMTRDYARALARHKEHKTAIGGLWVETGFKQTGFKFTKLSRKTNGYRFSSRLLALLDSITSFSERPLYFIFFLGLAILVLAATVAAILMFHFLSGRILPGWISVMASVWFLGGLAIFCIGVVGLYISRIFVETKMRPYTIIRRSYENEDLR